MSALKREAPRESRPASRPPALDINKERSAIIRVAAKTQGEVHAAVAKTLMRPEVGAASAIEVWQPETHDVNALASELSAQIDAVNRGDLRRAEGLLTSQAHTLNELFNLLLRRATGKMTLQQCEAYMRMAMRAQSQCRMTLEALAEMKNPKAIAFVRQANIAHGPQQVNNGTGARAGEIQPAHPGLLEQQHGEWMDPGAPGQAVGANKTVEAVGAIDRAAKRRGKGHRGA